MEDFLRYTKANGIKLNESKTEYMIITPKNIVPLNDTKVYYDGHIIKQVKCIKLLGVHIDDKLTFKEHCDQMIQRNLRKYIPIFYQLREYLDVKHLLDIYYANVQSIISYCILAYYSGNSSNIHKLNVIQKRILKVVFRANRIDILDYMKKHRLMNIDDIYKYKLLCLGYKMKYEPQSLPQFLQGIYKTKELLSLRNKSDFIIPFHRIKMAQNCVDFKVAKTWNKLPKEIKEITKFSMFSRQVKELLGGGQV